MLFKSSNAKSKVEADLELRTPSQHVANNPTDLDETGLEPGLLLNLMLKHLYDGDALTLLQLSQRLALRGGIVQSLLSEAKETGLVENRQMSSAGQQRFSLSGEGRRQAQNLFATSGYLGPAPVPLAQYNEVCRQQSSRNRQITREAFTEGMKEVVVPAGLLDQLGPALNSTRPLLIYGLPGTGKSFLCRQLNRLFCDEVLIPHAVAVGHHIIQVYDPHFHHRVVDGSATEALELVAEAVDGRWHRCRRPLLMVGGELTLSMLDVSFDSNSRTFRAPIGLTANNGILLIDDLGRQTISPKAIFNRWILPLEEGRDFLSLPSGEHFEVPFEQLLLFSTNLAPTELVDEAFLRRLGYKVHFGQLDKPTYLRIWQQNCDTFGLESAPGLTDWMLDRLYPEAQKPLLPCHPRDLLSIVSDQVQFGGLSPVITRELLRHAWDLYFVKG
ncbi:AAA family ATPase [Ferrimonas balearica]|uniref:AAA family ATPase n=1 Tax=Ferrimonas balearica TaxID=44012 RepID=UPI001C99E1E2|nr:AAA family ATPase [Ferrimonas balearica]MBY5920841.1 AAA family ATPase [Ferrimonas balearica]MBY5996474.1 AAA family ATPase [Ferrimonas balearica]